MTYLYKSGVRSEFSVFVLLLSKFSTVTFFMANKTPVDKLIERQTQRKHHWMLLIDLIKNFLYFLSREPLR